MMGDHGDEWDRAESKARQRSNAHPDSNRRYGPQQEGRQDNGSAASGSRRRRRVHDIEELLSSAEFLAQMKPPDYLINGLMLRGAAYTLTGNTGGGKTLLALLMAIRIAQDGWFAGRKCRKGTVAP